jgi:hypothetical protein
MASTRFSRILDRLMLTSTLHSTAKCRSEQFHDLDMCSNIFEVLEVLKHDLILII